MPPSLTIRPVNPELDDPAIAELCTICRERPVTVETLKDWYREPFHPDYLLHRAVAVTDDGRIVGYVVIEHETFYEPGRFYLQVMVNPPDQYQGIGSQLYDYAVPAAESLGAISYYSSIRENHPELLPFAEKRGFSLYRIAFESTIDLKNFDESAFTGVIEAVEADGIWLFSLADVGDTEAARRKLHHVNYQSGLDDPGTTGSYMDFDQFNQMFNTAAWFRAAGQILAADGDEYIGLSAVGYFAETNSMYNMFTGVMPAYRGRRIAQALKLLSTRYAKQSGVDYIRTNNDSENAPMLAINQKLGYKPQPGIYRLKKD
jgi:GNAT superfamily N-acetyltransferase